MVGRPSWRIHAVFAFRPSFAIPCKTFRPSSFLPVFDGTLQIW
jgi:hypothetical protein